MRRSSRSFAVVMGFGVAACGSSDGGSGRAVPDAGDASPPGNGGSTGAGGSNPSSGGAGASNAGSGGADTGGSVNAPADMGQSCVPSQESSATFAGFNPVEATIDTQAGCADACIIVNFAGRVSCPYGQANDGSNPTQLSPTLTADQRCYLPNAAPSQVTEVTVPVAPQLANRPPDRAVYCSCSCGGGSGPHCACPGGFDCAPLAQGLEGSYCVKSGTQVTSISDLNGNHCTMGTIDCGAAHPVFATAHETDAGGAGTVVTSFIFALSVAPGRCLPRELEVTNGQVDCSILEATSNPSEADCTARPGRKNASRVQTDAARAQMRFQGVCDNPPIPGSPCSAFSVCELQQADVSCLQATPSAASIGWCYVSPNQGLGDPAVVASCPSFQPELIRFVDPQGQTPAKDATTLLACGGFARP